MSLNLGPINGQIWTRGPRIYGFYYTKVLQQILESIWGHLKKMLLSGLQKNVKFGKDGHRQNDEDPINKVLKIMDMKPISC